MMTAKTQAALLLKGTAIPEDAFETLPKEKFETWTATQGSVTKAKAELFSDKNANAIRGLGLNPDGEDPCASLELEMVSKSKDLAANITARCFQAAAAAELAEMDQATEEYNKLPKRLLHLVPYADLRKKDKQYWTKMTGEVLGYLASREDFCAQVEAAIFNQIPAAALSAMTSKCMASYRSRTSLTQVQVAAMPKDVFAGVPAASLSPELVAMMSGEQLAHADSSVGTLLTEAVVSKMSASVTGEQWKVCPAAAFAGIDTAEKLAAIVAAAMRGWTAAAIKAVPAAVAKTLSAEQAKEIGEGSAETVAETVKYLMSLELSEEARAAVRARLPADAAAESDMTMVWIGLGVVAALAVIGGVAYYFLRRD